MSKVSLWDPITTQLPIPLHLWGFGHLAALASAKGVPAAELVHQSPSPRLPASLGHWSASTLAFSWWLYTC